MRSSICATLTRFPYPSAETESLSAALLRPMTNDKDSKNDRAGNCNCTKCIGTDEISDPQTVDELIRHLQKVRQNDRRRKEDQLLPKPTFRKIILFRHSTSPFL